MSDLTVITGGDEGGVLLTRKARDHHKFCGHLTFELDDHARRIYCGGCGVEVDPIDVLTKLARVPDKWRAQRDRAKREAERATAELADIKRQVRNAKAQLRRAS